MSWSVEQAGDTIQFAMYVAEYGGAFTDSEAEATAVVFRRLAEDTGKYSLIGELDRRANNPDYDFDARHWREVKSYI